MRVSELRDMLAIGDMDPDAREATGLTVLAQEFWHGLTSDRGTFIDAPSTGINLRNWQHKALTPRTVTELVEGIRNEGAKDTRIAATRVVIASQTPRSLEIEITLSTDDGNVTLIADVGEAGALLKGIQ